MNKNEEKALAYIKKNKTALNYVRSMLISNSVVLAILVTDYMTNIVIDDMFIFWCSVIIALGTVLGIISNIMICIKLSKRK